MKLRENLKNLYADIILHRKCKQLTMDIGSVCNAKCPFCARQVEGHPFLNNDVMSEEVFDTIFKQLKKKCFGGGIRDIFLYAYGEPLLNKNAGKFIRKLRTLKHKKLFLSTNTTNMENFTEDLMYLDILQFSIDGWDKESYEKARVNLKFEDTIEKLKNFDIEVKKRKANGLHAPGRIINCLYTKGTDFEAFIKLWSPYVEKIYFTPLRGTLYAENGQLKKYKFENTELGNLIFDYKQNKNPRPVCYNIRNILTLNSAGKVTLCCADFTQNMDLGDYRDLKKAFNNKISKEIARKMLLNEPNYCDACNLPKCPPEEIEQYKQNLRILKQKYDSGNCEIVI